MADQTISMMDYTIFSADLNEIRTTRKIMINTINPHSYCVAKKDELFRTALKSSDVLLPDGIGIVLAARFLRGKKIRKIAGADVHQYLIERANREGLKVFYLGASEMTLQKISDRLQQEYPHVKVKVFSPPYKPVFSVEENDEMIARINAFRPDYLFVGMTAPKQEKWAYSNKDQLNVNIICSIGAVFDFFAGSVKRPHPFWIKIGLEWFVRFLKEPKRLAKRNLESMPKFIWFTLREKLRRE